MNSTEGSACGCPFGGFSSDYASGYCFACYAFGFGTSYFDHAWSSALSPSPAGFWEAASGGFWKAACEWLRKLLDLLPAAGVDFSDGGGACAAALPRRIANNIAVILQQARVQERPTGLLAPCGRGQSGLARDDTKLMSTGTDATSARSFDSTAPSIDTFNTTPARHFDSVCGNVGDGPVSTRRGRLAADYEAAAAAAEAVAAGRSRAPAAPPPDDPFDEWFLGLLLDVGSDAGRAAWPADALHAAADGGDGGDESRPAAHEEAAMAAELAEGDYEAAAADWLHRMEEAARAERVRLVLEQEAQDAARPLHERDCTICLERLDSSDNGVFVQLGCHRTHCFHSGCLARAWAVDTQMRCPCCRSGRSADPAVVSAGCLPCCMRGHGCGSCAGA